jgi:hypothetical protein
MHSKILAKIGLGNLAGVVGSTRSLDDHALHLPILV